MQKYTTGKLAKRILLMILIAFTVAINSPTLVQISNLYSPIKHAEQFTAYAVAPDTGTGTGTAAELKTLQSGLLTLENTLNEFLWPALVLIGGLMENTILFDNGMEARLREIWIPIRNIMNIFFVLILVGIALYNIVGLSEDNYTIKAILPKIIIGIIAVNFSFLGIKVFLDVTNVLTVSIFALPDQVSEGLATPAITDSMKARFCTFFDGFTLAEASTMTADQRDGTRAIDFWKQCAKQSVTTEGVDSAADINAIKALIPAEKLPEVEACVAKKQKDAYCAGSTLSASGELFFKSWGSKNAALLLAISMQKVLYLQDAPINTTGEFIVSVLASAILYIVFAISYLALLVVLLARLVVCWLAIILSPVLMLGIAIPEIKSKVEAIGKITDEFVNIAVAPIIIALSLTVGWIMLKSMQTVNLTLTTGGGTGVSSVPALSTFQDLIIAIATVAVIWLGVFTAADKTIARSVTGALSGAVKGAGAWVAQAPLKYARIFPGKGGQKQSFFDMIKPVTAGLAKMKPEYENGGNITSMRDVNNGSEFQNHIRYLGGTKMSESNRKTLKPEWEKIRDGRDSRSMDIRKPFEQKGIVGDMNNFLETGNASQKLQNFFNESAPAAANPPTPQAANQPPALTPTQIGKEITAALGNSNTTIGTQGLATALKKIRQNGTFTVGELETELNQEGLNLNAAQILEIKNKFPTGNPNGITINP